MKIKKGDNIIVLSGKDKGKKGKVESVDSKNEKALVPEINTYKRHVKKSDAFPQGGIIELSRPITISNIAIMCPKCDKSGKIGYKMENDKKVRFCKKCKAII